MHFRFTAYKQDKRSPKTMKKMSSLKFAKLQFYSILTDLAGPQQYKNICPCSIKYKYFIDSDPVNKYTS